MSNEKLDAEKADSAKDDAGELTESELDGVSGAGENMRPRSAPGGTASATIRRGPKAGTLIDSSNPI